MVTWDQIRNYLSSLANWLNRQSPGTVARSTLAPHLQYVQYLLNWFNEQRNIDPQARSAWIAYLNQVLLVARNRQCQGIELLGVCQQPGTPTRR